MINNVEVSLIIPTFNKVDRLKIVLESLKRLRYSENSEIIIVNDGSKDNTEDVLNEFSKYIYKEKKFRLNIILIRNSGRSYARNIGIESSKGKLIIFSDDDLILNPMFIYYHRAMHQKNNNLVVHGQIFSLPHQKFFKNPATGELYNGEMAKSQLMSKIITPEMLSDNRIDAYLQSNSKLSKFEKDIMHLYENTSVDDSYVRWIGFTGGNVSVLKSNICKVGCFDPKMGREWGCEDIELGYRLYKESLSFEYSKQSINYHLNHYREGFDEIHNNSISYFINKHNDETIRLLNNYFHGELTSLVDWKTRIDSIGT